MASIDDLLDRFPKTRPALSPEMEKIHLDLLIANRERQTFVSKFSNALEAWMHNKVASGGGQGSAGQQVLEIGAGTLNHLKFERDLSGYDVIEPVELLYRDKAEIRSVRNVYSSIDQIGQSQTYDRVIAIATLEHLTELPYMIAQAILCLKDGGVFQAGIPSEGGFLWGLGWRMTTGLAFWLKTGMNFKEHMEYEHVNDAHEIEALVRHFFRDVSVQRFPVGLRQLSLYSYLEARNPDLARCQEILSSASGNNRVKAD
jgi:hypothetical protein